MTNQPEPRPAADGTVHVPSECPGDQLDSPSSLAARSLEWIAFRYVAGELSSDESTIFEEQLAADQDAREAVAAAVEIAVAIQVAGIDGWVPTLNHLAGGTGTETGAGTETGTGTESGRTANTTIAARTVAGQPERRLASGPASLRWKASPRRRWRTIASWCVVGSLACLGLVSMVDHWADHTAGHSAGKRLPVVADRSSSSDQYAAHLGKLARLWSEERPRSGSGLSEDSEDLAGHSSLHDSDSGVRLTPDGTVIDDTMVDGVVVYGMLVDGVLVDGAVGHGAETSGIETDSTEFGGTAPNGRTPSGRAPNGFAPDGFELSGEAEASQLGGELVAAEAPAWMIAAVAAKSGTLSDEAAEASGEPVGMPESAPDAPAEAGNIP